MMVLFNDMLQRLADSQARTLLYVILATFASVCAARCEHRHSPYLPWCRTRIAAATVISATGCLGDPAAHDDHHDRGD
ncbi:MAG: hypothetical protein U5O39_00660 [Gammaproteobacteria bacterium]|nr:hypothetical protein [Gammaproteobacteria bacterium]